MREVNLERVLLVNQPNGHDRIKIGLEAAGFEADEADDAETALNIATARAPAVVIIEIHRPTMDGWALARRLRMLFGSRIRLLALTSRGDPEDRARSRAAGFDLDVYLVKPVPLSPVEQVMARDCLLTFPTGEPHALSDQRPRQRPEPVMASPEPVLPETDERRCPYCRYQRLAADGHVTVAQGMIKEKLRCEVCGIRFVFVRKVTG
jgi:CheY-like chemotaxis protein